MTRILPSRDAEVSLEAVHLCLAEIRSSVLFKMTSQSQRAMVDVIASACKGHVPLGGKDRHWFSRKCLYQLLGD